MSPRVAVGKQFLYAVFSGKERPLKKIRANKTEKQEVITIADIFRAKVVDVSKDNLMIELTGNVNEMEELLKGAPARF